MKKVVSPRDIGIRKARPGDKRTGLFDAEDFPFRWSLREKDRSGGSIVMAEFSGMKR